MLFATIVEHGVPGRCKGVGLCVHRSFFLGSVTTLAAGEDVNERGGEHGRSNGDD